MISAILAIVAAIISFFASKKAGADDATAAAVGVAAGAGTYWTATSTEWGKARVEDIDEWWTGVRSPDGEPVFDEDGAEVLAPPGVVQLPDGTWTKGDTVVGTIGDVLKDWGPSGTAAVVGTTVVASKTKIQPWMVAAAVGGAVLLLLR